MDPKTTPSHIPVPHVAGDLTGHPAFSTGPHAGQFAKGGAWESAWSFLAGRPPTSSELDAFLAGSGEVAFEAFFGGAFFGVRWTGPVAEVRDRSRACVAAWEAAVDGADFFSRLSHLTGLRGWGREVAFAEVGAVNAWRSVGAFRAPEPAQALRDFDGLWEALQRTPLAAEAAHPKAVELACKVPVPHWFALPVSSLVSPFEWRRDRLRQALEFAAGGRGGAAA